MTFAWIILFLLSAGSLFHSYFAYPALLFFLSGIRRPRRPHFEEEDNWPAISVLLSVYNEETVIEQKLESLFRYSYPGSIWVYAGSDASTDGTNAFLAGQASQRADLRFFPFSERRGKPSVLNDLAAAALAENPAGPDHLLLITDANVFLEPDTLRNLARHFKDRRVGLVDAHMINTGLTEEGISRSETQYIRTESRIKFWEGQIWGAMIGPFGGCYMLRSDLFDPIPPHFLVDDFFLAMRAFEKGAQALNDLEARCYEAVSHEIGEEFRRKARIAAGNFQNMGRFRHLWFPPFSPLQFAFFSHKVLRWLGPFFLFFTVISSFALAMQGFLFFQVLLGFELALFIGLPLLDRVLLALGIHRLWLRHVRYFFAMNLALLAGFFRWLQGVRSGAWEPPKRV